MTPILYSFRRCPYAMRARLALGAAEVRVHLREVVLREKPSEFLEVSQSATVPCLVTSQGAIDESLDIMIWALKQHDPHNWLEMPDQGWHWISCIDGPFKKALDRTKYASRYPDADPVSQRATAAVFLSDLNDQMGAWIFERASIADYAILPFVRQFAFIDKAWFDTQPWPNLHDWLGRFLASDPFRVIMDKYPQWEAGDAPIWFPEQR